MLKNSDQDVVFSSFCAPVPLEVELRDAESALIWKSGLQRADSSVSKQVQVSLCVVQVHMVLFLVSLWNLINQCM